MRCRRTRPEAHVYDALIAPFAEFEFMRRALVGALALALGAAPIGVFLMLRRMSLVGDAMAHAILPGAAIGFLISGLNLFAMTVGGLIAGFVVAFGAGVVARVTELKEDASLAAFFLISLALGVTIVSIKGTNIDLLHFLFGTVLALDDQTLMLIAVNATRHAGGARGDLPPAGARMRRSGLSALGEPRRRRRRIWRSSRWWSSISSAASMRSAPCWRSAHDAAGRHRALLGARHHRHDADRGRGAMLSGYAGLLLSFHSKVPSGPAVILVAAGSMSCRCCSAASAGCCASFSRAPSRSMMEDVMARSRRFGSVCS